MNHSPVDLLAAVAPGLLLAVEPAVSELRAGLEAARLAAGLGAELVDPAAVPAVPAV